MWNYHFLVDRPLWDQWLPTLYMPFSMSGDRLAGVYADELVAAGFFPKGARVAIVRYDNPQHVRFAQLFRPRLAAAGVDVVEEVALRQPPSAAGAGDTAAQISNAILRLRASNVTHVAFVPTGGAVPFIFMNEAESQGYRPRYAMNSLDIPYFVSDQAPAGQLAGALAIGWSPASDTHREQALAGDVPPGREEVDGGRLGPGQLRLTPRGPEVVFEVDGWVLTVRGTIPVTHLVDLARRLRPVE